MGRSTVSGCCGRPGRTVGTLDDPGLVGLPDGRPPVLVRAVQSVGGLERGTEGWVTGSTLDALVARGTLVLV